MENMKDYVFEVEELEMDMQTLRCIMKYSYMDVSNELPEEVGFVWNGIYGEVIRIAGKLEELKKKGFEAIQKNRKEKL